jgi:NAD(P)H-hydrate repair Nnr-like enzyme with NAD(P)H-hydrate epimerase domain
MRRVCTAAEVREADARAVLAVGEEALVDRAGAAVAARAVDMLGRVYGATVVVLAGSGHNGVDALLAGERLARRGAVVHVVRSSDSEGDLLWQASLNKVIRGPRER